MGRAFFGCVVILYVACLNMKTVSSMDVEEFFPDIKGNLTNVTWAHAVNNASYLNTILGDYTTMMIEADIQLGTINGSNDTTPIPIMAHPPNNVSDLSLESFLINIQNSNANISRTKKGAKLDFKTIEAFNASLAIINRTYNGSYPLWINADILPGPVNATTVPVNATQFFEGCKNFSDTTLSIGWTTQYGANITGNYSDEHINSMIQLTTQNNSTNRFTFPVRAGLAAESLQELQKLLNATRNSTLTIWSSAGDNVNVAKLRGLISEIGINKTFIDVPEDLLKELKLDDLPITGSTSVPQQSASTQQAGAGAGAGAGTTQKPSPSGTTQGVVVSIIALVSTLFLILV